MGSKGSKPRKPSHSQSRQHNQSRPHTATHDDAERMMHEEHAAILDTMGLGNISAGTKRVLWTVVVLMLVAALVGLLILTTI